MPKSPEYAQQVWEAIEYLRREEADMVTIISDNPDFNGQPNSAIECHGFWTDWWTRRFTGNNVLEALEAAVKAKKEKKE